MKHMKQQKLKFHVLLRAVVREIVGDFHRIVVSFSIE